MAYIDLYLEDFGKSANAVQQFLDNLNSNMNNATQQVETLNSGWEGQDYLEFKNQWQSQYEGSSAFQQMSKSLESYKGLLEFAGKQYSEAQSKAYERANNL